MNQEGWYSLMRGILFQTEIDTLYVTLITDNFDTKNSSKKKYLGVIELVMVSSRCLMQKMFMIKNPPWGNPDPESMDLLYGGHSHISLLF